MPSKYLEAEMVWRISVFMVCYVGLFTRKAMSEGYDEMGL